MCVCYTYTYAHVALCGCMCVCVSVCACVCALYLLSGIILDHFSVLFTKTRSLNSSQSSPNQNRKSYLLATLLERSRLSPSQLELQASHLITSSFDGDPFYWFLYSDKTSASMESSCPEDETLCYVSDSSFLSIGIVTLVFPISIPVRSFYSSLNCS